MALLLCNYYSHTTDYPKKNKTTTSEKDKTTPKHGCSKLGQGFSIRFTSQPFF